MASGQAGLTWTAPQLAHESFRDRCCSRNPRLLRLWTVRLGLGAATPTGDLSEPSPFATARRMKGRFARRLARLDASEVLQQAPREARPPAGARQLDDGIQDDALDVLAGGSGYVRRYLAQLQPALLSPVLELGSGTGNVTLELLRMGHEVTASDRVERRLEALVAREAREVGSGGLSVRVLDLAKKDFRSQLGNARFRSVVAINVIEHIEHDDECVRAVFDLLPPGGCFGMLVPAHQALYSAFDSKLGHFRRYTIDSVKRLLGGAGFNIASARYFNAVGALGWLLNCRWLGKTRIPEGQFKLFEALASALSVEDRVQLPFGLSVIAVGVRPG